MAYKGCDLSGRVPSFTPGPQGSASVSCARTPQGRFIPVLAVAEILKSILTNRLLNCKSPPHPYGPPLPGRPWKQSIQSFSPIAGAQYRYPDPSLAPPALLSPFTGGSPQWMAHDGSSLAECQVLEEHREEEGKRLSASCIPFRPQL